MHACIGEGSGNPLQCSCLENPRDQEAWCGAVYEVVQSQTQLKWLSSSNSKQSDKIQLWRSPFLIRKQAVVPCLVLTVASWAAYWFLRRQVRRSGITISWRIFHSLLWSTQSKALRNLMLTDLFLSFFYSLHSWNEFHLAMHIVLFTTGFYLSVFGFRFPHSYP